MRSGRSSSSSLARHAGLAPAENASGAFAGQAHISRRGRPGLRLTVWRAVWPVLIHNPVMAAKYAAMTQAADAAALLRWIYSMIVHDTGWDPRAAVGQHALAEAA
jgi:transposase